ncbi:MAG TPA: 30S ribosomal protein S12 methylthiotransferase RimO [Oligoflexia bacterium]|nr:30S ribosomal protein S12 methylthiotransferase RimO [Oligoflexia bacterium]HMR24484.1 30S ribosomal protein S12 methylthiotransferase RimO [Oligoflexia bacterium]
MSKETKKVGMISLGCPKNLVDSEVMLGHLKNKGWEITDNQDDADVMVVNTCSFIEDSKQESIETILDVAQLKSKGKLKKLIVAGCLSQRYAKDLEQEMPEVDHFLGTGEFESIANFVGSAQAVVPNDDELPMARSLVTKPKFTYDYATPRVAVLPKHTAYVKIAEGCSRTCSFCIIPRLRGPGQSRSIDSVVKEVQGLAERGTKEIHLLAQDLTAYGIDRNDGTSLYGLLKELDQIDGLEWIRLMYAYPQHISDDLIDLIAQSKRICNYLDMPLQHIDSELLATMRRKVDEQATRDLLKKLQDRIPNLTLRTTLIVGFPGETQAQFQKLYNFVEEFEFDRLGVFTYSLEENTGAYLMKNQIDEAIKQERKHQLMTLQQGISAKKNEAMLGKKIKVLIDKHLPQESMHLSAGRAESQALDIDGEVFVSKRHPIGSFVEVEVEAVSEYDLYA